MNKVDREVARVKSEARWRRIKLGMDAFVLFLVSYGVVGWLVWAWESAKLVK